MSVTSPPIVHGEAPFRPSGPPAPLREARILVAASALSLVFALVLAFGTLEVPELGPYLRADATARLFLVVINTAFFGITLHTLTRVQGGSPELPQPARFTACALALLFTANLTVLSGHFLATWVGLELTTLTLAPLIVRPGAPGSQLASWRYFLFSAVGLGLALLGLLCLGHAGGGGALQGWAGEPDPWRNLGLGLVILGYGTKLGLAPMYMWLPETYEEAPPPVTSMLAAVQFNCTLVALIRVLQVFQPANNPLVSTLLVTLGLGSVAVATASLIATTRIRRLVAYASIVHGGVIAIGLGVGGGAAYGVLLYAVSNTFIKAMLFLTAGKIESEYQTQETGAVRGVIKDMPFSGLFLMAGTFALLGFPPFGSFVGELLILSGLVRSGYLMTFATLGFLVSVTFVATGRTVFPMIWGEPHHPVVRTRQSFLAFVPKLVFLILLVVLGLHLPAPVNQLFREVAVSLGDP